MAATRTVTCIACWLALAACTATTPSEDPPAATSAASAAAAPSPPAPATELAPVSEVPWAVDEATALGALVQTPVAEAFLAAAARLPAGVARTLYRDDAGQWLTAAEADALSADAREALRSYEFDADSFYTTKYGSPLAYVRALELLGAHGLQSLDGQRVLDFGSGTLGHLRVMALCGADAVGVDVDPFLPTLYAEPDDHGPLGDGAARLVHGRWPGDADTAASVGARFDVFTSKNTLKRGYVHPEREAEPHMLIDLGVDDEAYLSALHDALVPGGLAMLYNLCPPMAGPDEDYVPWADGRSPFTPEQWRAAGFEVLAFDVVDDAPARAMAHALAWDEQGMDPDTQLFAWYTVARRAAD